MERRITGFHQDGEMLWVAELDCGHDQHVRHDPPWQVRPWVLSEASRQARLGTMLNCIICDADLPTVSSASIAAEMLPPGFSPDAQRAYHDARLQGLCHEGALEVAQDCNGPAPQGRPTD